MQASEVWDDKHYCYEQVLDNGTAWEVYKRFLKDFISEKLDSLCWYFSLNRQILLLFLLKVGIILNGDFVFFILGENLLISCGSAWQARDLDNQLLNSPLCCLCLFLLAGSDIVSPWALK